jgi:hypothetical protein
MAFYIFYISILNLYIHKTLKNYIHTALATDS